jgi:integrase
MTSTRAVKGGGSLKERAGYPGVWRLRWRDGKGAEHGTTFRGSRTAAAAELRERVRLSDGAIPVTKQIAEQGRTVGDLLDAWLAFSERSGKAARYVAENRRAIETRLRPALGGIRLERLTVKDIDDMLGKWTREGLTGATMRRYLAPLRTALGQARRWSWIDANPAALATIPSGKASAETLTPTPDEHGALVRKAAERSDAAMVTAIRLACTTSARRGELAALRWSDVDLDAGTLTIARSADRYGNEGRTKTRQSVRTLQLDAGTVAMLKERQRTSDGEHVIGLRVDQITDRFRKLVELTPGVRRGVRFHDQRHAGASHMLAAGVARTAVAARLGHASARTTMQVYAHALPGADDSAPAIMGKLALARNRRRHTACPEPLRPDAPNRRCGAGRGRCQCVVTSGELAALRWSDVDLDAGIVTLARSADRCGHEGPTKTRARRTVQLDAGTLAMLRGRQGQTDADHVLGLRADKITDRFRKLVADTRDVRDGIRFHDERHAGARK